MPIHLDIFIVKIDDYRQRFLRLSSLLVEHQAISTTESPPVLLDINMEIGEHMASLQARLALLQTALYFRSATEDISGSVKNTISAITG